MFKRKVDLILSEWKSKKNKHPLIISGARQIGKTTSIEEFGKTYSSFVEINFVANPQYKTIFANGYDVDSIVREISLLNPFFKFIPNETLIFFDEIQEYPDVATSLKFFAIDGKFDVVCSGSLLGVNYKRISSIPVGFKEEYTMRSFDFEEFLWACGYTENQIDDIFGYLIELKPLPEIYFKKLKELYRNYIFVGGMPEAISSFIETNTFSNVFDIQKRIYKDYEDDITKYVDGLDIGKVKNIYRHISTQLAKDNHKFQITKIGHGSRKREYAGIEEWLKDAGIINIAYNLNSLTLPLSGNEIADYFRIYFADHSLFIASLDEEAKKDLIINGNYEIYNGALYESLVAESLIKSGCDLYFYKNESSTIELDFILRIKNEIVPIEVKRSRGRSKSLNAILNEFDNEIIHGIKMMDGNIGLSDNKLTIPYFLSFMLKRFCDKSDIFKW